MESAIKMVRVYLHEADHGKRHKLTQEILELLRATYGIAHITVFRGVAGSDERGETHATDLLRLVVNLPEAVEFFDTPDRVEAALTGLSALTPGRIVTWDATLR